MVYFAIKELSVYAEDVIIVTSSLTKDINSKTDLVYRPNAIRALCKITDPSMVQSIERFFKQAIVDRNSSVSSAALVSSFHLFSASKEAVKRWVNEVQEAINGRGSITQYHALGLLYFIKAHDRMSVLKLVQSLSKSSMLRSPFAYCMLIRYTAKMLADHALSEIDSAACVELLCSWMRHKSEMVSYEAARSLCALATVSSGTELLVGKLPTAISALQAMLVNHRPALRFAAARALNRLAVHFPDAVSVANFDMEKLVGDSNRSVATMAITSLLKSGNEGSVDRLLKQITGFMADISDEFKVIVVEAVRSLCLKFPQKYQLMLTFLSNILRDEGDYEYKRSIVQALFDIVHSVPESVEYALSQLAEFIEDCEYTRLAARVLYLLGAEGPKASKPSKYIRYIYNRLLLENATVRAAAVAALGRFAIALPDTRAKIVPLLKRSMDDADDEVRDRAVFLVNMLSSEESCHRYLSVDTVFVWSDLEARLVDYLRDPSHFETTFNTESVAAQSRDNDESDRLNSSASLQKYSLAAQENLSPILSPSASGNSRAAPTNGVDGSGGSVGDSFAKDLASNPALQSLGALFKASRAIPLTENDTEYVVDAVKLVFEQHLVFRFSVRNTLPDYQLGNVYVKIGLGSASDPSSVSGLTQEALVPITSLNCNETDCVYVVFRRGNGGAPVAATFTCLLCFNLLECDPSTGDALDDKGFADEYSLEDLDVYVGDYMKPVALPKFAPKWAEMDPEATGGRTFEAVETYKLTTVPNIKSAVEQLLQVLGMAPIENTAQVGNPQTPQQIVPSHQLYLSGLFVGNIPCLSRCRMLFDPNQGVALEIAVRSTSDLLAHRLADAIA